MANKFGLGSLSLETKKPNTTAWINKSKPYFVDQIGDTLQGDLDMNNFSITNLKSPENDNDAIHKKYLMEQLNLIETFFQAIKRLNVKKVLHFINGRKIVETKEYESNDENNKVDHLYEIKSSGKYIDRFRMLIIPDKEEDFLTLSDFDMIMETETPPSTNIIRNPEPQKNDISFYEFLRATDFEYVKLYFVDNDIFTSLDIHKCQQNQKFLIRDGVYVYISIYIEKPKFSVHLNKINDSKEQISLVTVNVFIEDSKHEVALSEIHLI
ncbi:hypothetical protein LOTGIDRAFT_164274 [Lottia gigantea]|uniref:Uncharacterized protein n=1 Tax=Lottia gigantea TaxID=225164 RepID=V3ZGM7_LOTGI|nr:hypothetical protein LOTGIDRAFT_164274 [Lottia gigantea]ESO90353.1 hypothetical protein LOTGIDRAFT_164274 [Lottia gigantea]